MNVSIVVHEFIEPQGPVTHRKCVVPKGLLEYLIGIKLDADVTEYYMDISLYTMLLKLPHVQPHLTLHYGGKYEPNSKSTPS